MEFTKSKEKLSLLVVLMIGVVLSLYRLGEVPSGLYVDEALSGYNAYSILKTGKDEYGKFLPIAFRFFGSYSPPLYVYLTVPVVKFFGLTIFATRLISAISSVFMTLVVYFFLKEMSFLKSKYSAAIGALIFTISPWNLLFARAGYELYLGFFIFSLGVFFLLKSLKNPKYVVVALATLSISTYTSHTQRYLVPLFMVLSAVMFRDIFLRKSYRVHIMRGLFIAFLIQIPNLYLLTTPAFFTKSGLFYSDVVRSQADKIAFLPYPIAWMLSFVRELMSQYLTYYSPKSLFFSPDPDMQRSMPELSVFYHYLIIPYLVGLYAIFNKLKNDPVRFVLLLIVISPILTTLVGDPFSTQRALPLLLPMAVVISVGTDRIINKIHTRIWIPAFSFLLLLSLLFLWRSYFVLLPDERAQAWSWGYKELATEIQNRSTQKFVIDRSRTKPAYIELAFFMKYAPQKFHVEFGDEVSTNYYYNTDFSEDYTFGNVEIRNINWQTDVYDELILVGDEYAISDDQANEHKFDKIFEIRNPVNEIVFQGYRTNPTEKCKADPENGLCDKNI